MQEEGLGFAPDELDLAHLDQTQTVSAPSPRQTQESKPSHAGPDGLSSLPRALPQEAVPQQLTHLDSHGRAQMVDVGQVPVVQILCLQNIALVWTPSCSKTLTCASAEDSNSQDCHSNCPCAAERHCIHRHCNRWQGSQGRCFDCSTTCRHAQLPFNYRILPETDGSRSLLRVDAIATAGHMHTPDVFTALLCGPCLVTPTSPPPKPHFTPPTPGYDTCMML